MYLSYCFSLFWYCLSLVIFSTTLKNNFTIKRFANPRSSTRFLILGHYSIPKAKTCSFFFFSNEGASGENETIWKFLYCLMTIYEPKILQNRLFNFWREIYEWPKKCDNSNEHGYYTHQAYMNFNYSHSEQVWPNQPVGQAHRGMLLSSVVKHVPPFTQGEERHWKTLNQDRNQFHIVINEMEWLKWAGWTSFLNWKNNYW